MFSTAPVVEVKPAAPLSRISLVRWEVFAVAAVVLVAAGLRLYRLGEADLWFDEAVNALNARGDFAQVFSNTREGGPNAILYPLIINLTQRLDAGALAVRLPAFLFGLGAVGVLLALPRVGVRAPVAIAAATLLALANFHVAYSQETHEYSLSVLVSAALIYFLCAWTEKPRDWTPLIGLVSLSALAPLASYGLGFAVLGVIATIVLQRVTGRKESGWLAAGLIFAAFALAATGAYFLAAQAQAPYAQSAHLAEHLLSRSGMFAPFWLALNSGGVIVYAAPGLIAGGLMACIFIAHVGFNARAPLALLDDAVLVAAVFAGLSAAIAGLLSLYPFGSPPHSLFLGPFIALAAAGAGAALLERLPMRARPFALAAAGLLVAVSAALDFARVPLLANLHPAFAKLAAFEVYASYEEVRAPLARVRATPQRRVYVYRGALPAVRFHAPDLQYAAGAGADGGGVAREIAKAAEGGEVAAIFSHVRGAHDAAAIEALRTACWRVVEDHVFRRSRLVVLAPPQRCLP